MRNRWTVGKDPVIGWIARLPEHRVHEVLRLGEETGVHRPVEAAITPLRAVRRVSSRIAYTDPGGVVTEDDITDLGAVLAAGPHAGPAEHHEPLSVLPTRSPGGGGQAAVLVTSHSDIWLPWCSARYEEGAHLDDLADNRELASRHTPRLNEFLARVGELTEQAGGSLRINPDKTSPDLAFQLHDRGVLLDAANPRPSG